LRSGSTRATGGASYPDATFDVAASTFGVDLRSRPARAAAELSASAARRRGIAITAWPEDDWSNLSARLRPDEFAPVDRAALGGRVVRRELLPDFELSFERRGWVIEAPSAEELWELLAASVPPLRAWLGKLDAGGERRARREYLPLLADGRLRRENTCWLSALGVSIRDEAVGLLQALIRLNTVNPAGERDPCRGAACATNLEPFGVECELYARVPGRANLVARIRGKGDGPRLLLLSHTDTVLADPAEWSVDPWSASCAMGTSGGAALST